MVKLLVLDADNHAKLKKAKLVNGCVTINGKQFYLDKADPILLDSVFGSKPLYIVKWDSPLPSVNLNWRGMKVKVEKLSHIEPKFADTKDYPSPEMFRKIMGMKILGNMIKTKREFPSLIMFLLGCVIGVAILYALISFQVVSV